MAEIEPTTIWKGKGPIIYSFSIEKPQPSESSSETTESAYDRPGDAWNYRLSITGAPGEYENRVPEIFFLADTPTGIIRDMGAYIDLSLSGKDKQFLSLPPISMDNTEIIDNTNTFKNLDVKAIFSNAMLIADSQPPPGEPVYIIEITKGEKENNANRYNVSIIYADGFVDHTGLQESEQSLTENVNKFSNIPSMQIPIVIAKYITSTAQQNEIPPSPTNIKLINLTDNPEFTSQQILATIDSVIAAQPLQVQMPMPTPPNQYAAPLYEPMLEQRIRTNYGPLQPNPAAIQKQVQATEEGPESQTMPQKPKEAKEEEEKEAEEKEVEEEKEKKEEKKKISNFIEPKYGFDSVIGMDYAKKFFHDNVILGLERPDLFAKYKKNIHDGFLLYGPPGVGKTYLVSALAHEANMKLLVVSIHQLLDMWLGNTEKNIHEIFEQAKKNAPCIILFDEIDGLGVNRSISRQSGNPSSALALNQLLMEMDDLDRNNEKVIVIGTTNAPQDIDTALLRSGRFTNMLYTRPPDKEERAKLFEFYAKGIPQDKLDYDKLADNSNNFSPADIKATVNAAVTPLIAEAVKTDTEKKLTTDDLLKAIRSRRRIGGTLIRWYREMNDMLHKNKFTEEEKLLYSDMLEDIKKRIRPERKSKSEIKVKIRKRQRA
ncbi:MAG: ATP-binding protein [Candidatus Micrarchaeaceae archaeon]